MAEPSPAADQPTVHQVRVAVLDVHGRRSGYRAAGGGPARRTAAGLLVVVLALALGLSAALLAGGRSASLGRGPAGSDRPGAAGVAAAYGHPRRCLTITVLFPYARADFDRRNMCGRYAGDSTAIFRRVDGAWRTVLDAVLYTCPAAGVPRSVQAALGICAG